MSTSTTTGQVVSATTPAGQIIDMKTGYGTPWMQKWMQGIGATINAAFDQQKNLLPNSIPTPTATTIGGVKAIAGAVSQWIRSIGTDGTPQLSQPAFSDISGTASETQIPPLAQLSGAVTPGQVPQLSQLNGKVIAAQVPSLSALNGAVTADQVPDLSDLNGQITEAQLPAGLFSGTIVTAKLTGGGTNGSMTFVNGSLQSQVAAT